MSATSSSIRVDPKVVFTVDVEDWFHILEVPSTPHYDEWEKLPSRVERNFSKLLEILKENDVRATCFFLGWVAQRFPELVKRAVMAGHEVASHGHSHRVAYKMTRAEFANDIQDARKRLEDISGSAVLGYRAPGFSAISEIPWFFDAVRESGYLYDSSVFPAKRVHGGLEIEELGPHRLPESDLVEVPVTVTNFLGKRMCFFGGGYLRLFPLWLIDRKISEVLAEGRPVNVYVHPREIDPGHPRLPMKISRSFRSYTRMHTTEPKLQYLMRKYSSQTMISMIRQQWPDFGNRASLERAAQ